MHDGMTESTPTESPGSTSRGVEAPEGDSAMRLEAAGLDRVLLHIGYHKTATTWMQQRFFADPANDFEVLGKGFSARPFLVYPTPLEFDPNESREHYSRPVQAALAAGRTPVFSDERFSGNPFSGGVDSKELAHRLREVFGRARVVIVIREQREMVYSTYVEYVHEGGSASIQTFLFPQTRYAIPCFRFSHFAYHRLIGCYQQLFGLDRVLVLPFEMLRADPKAFLSRIGEFSGTRCDEPTAEERKLNVSPSASWLGLQRRCNPFVFSDDLNGYSIFAVPGAKQRLKRLIRKGPRVLPRRLDARMERRLREQVATAVRDRYEESNLATQALTDLNLEEYGYAT